MDKDQKTFRTKVCDLCHHSSMHPAYIDFCYWPNKGTGQITEGKIIDLQHTAKCKLLNYYKHWLTN